MSKKKIKQFLILAAGFLLCRVPVAGCYPFIPAFFAAAYLEELSRTLLAVTMVAGMAFFLPLVQAVKYAMAVLVVLVAVRLMEWVEKSCYTWFAAVAAGTAVTVLSASGELLKVKSSVSYPMAVLEGILVAGLVMIFSRMLHGFLDFELPERKRETEDREMKPDQQLLRYADSFQGLAKVFSGMERHEDFSGEEMSRILGEVTEHYCMGCDSCAVCWNQADGAMPERFKELITAIITAGKADRDLELELAEECPFSKEVVEDAVRVFEKVKLNMAWYNRLIENRNVIAEQLDAMAYIMEDLAEEKEDITLKKKRFISDVKYRARERGIRVWDAEAIRKKDGRERLVLTVSQKGEFCIPMKELTAAVNLSGKRIMVPVKDTRNIIGREKTAVVYEEETKYHSVFGVARRTKDGAMVSGDNFSALENGNGEMIFALSDGMGFGNRACKESELVLELIEKFLEAGFDKETAIRMMNSAMVIHGENERYSTVDLCSVNLYDGRSSFYKIGAAATFIKRGGGVEVLESMSLPVGSCTGIELEKMEAVLEDGEFLIMMTDGILEDLHVPDPMDTMQNIIESVQVKHPGKMAEKILERVLLFTGGRVRDDMTILVAAIWEN